MSPPVSPANSLPIQNVRTAQIRSRQPVSPVRMTDRHEGGHPQPRSWKIAAGKAPLVQDMHLVEEACRIVTGERNPPRQKRFGLKQVTVLIVVCGRETLEPGSDGRAGSKRYGAHQKGKADWTNHFPDGPSESGCEGPPPARDLTAKTHATHNRAATEPPDERRRHQERHIDECLAIGAQKPFDRRMLIGEIGSLTIELDGQEDDPGNQINEEPPPHRRGAPGRSLRIGARSNVRHENPDGAEQRLSASEQPPADDRPVTQNHPHDQSDKMRHVGDGTHEPGHAQHEPGQHRENVGL